MAKVKVELNSKGIRQYLQSDSVQEALKAHASRIAKASGEGYEAEAKQGRNRALANVKAVTREAGLDNSRNATLLKNARSKA